MANYHKFQIGDLIVYKNSLPSDYLFGKDYGIVIGYEKGQEGQTYYQVHWAQSRIQNNFSSFCYAQLELIASAKGACI